MPRESKRSKRERGIEVCRRMGDLYPDVRSALDFDGPFTLVICVLLSAHYDTPHGVACAMLLPISMEFNKPVVAERQARIATNSPDAQRRTETSSAVKPARSEASSPRPDHQGVFRDHLHESDALSLQ